MCLLLYKPAHVEFSDAQLNDFYSNNPDGFGVMYLEDGRVVTHKMVGKAKKVRRMYRRVAQGRECALHFRWRTHGDISIANTHPFQVNPNLYLMHNGVLSGYEHRVKSDTALFAEWMRGEEEKFPGVSANKVWRAELERTIGSSNKLILLSPSAGFQIVNEDTGRWIDGAWYSNDYAWDSPFGYYENHGYSIGRFARYPYTGAVYGSSAYKGALESWEDECERGSVGVASETAQDVMDYATTANEQSALSDLLAWMRDTGHRRSQDFACDFIAAQYGPQERDAIAEFLYEVFPLALEQVEREEETQDWDAYCAEKFASEDERIDAMQRAAADAIAMCKARKLSELDR